MLLSIDPAKIAKQLSELTPLSYSVTCTHIPSPVFKKADPVNVSVSSTVTAMPVEMERARERLLALRRSIQESGAELSDDAVDRKMREIRGR